MHTLYTHAHNTSTHTCMHMHARTHTHTHTQGNFLFRMNRVKCSGDKVSQTPLHPIKNAKPISGAKHLKYTCNAVVFTSQQLMQQKHLHKIWQNSPITPLKKICFLKEMNQHAQKSISFIIQQAQWNPLIGNSLKMKICLKGTPNKEVSHVLSSGLDFFVKVPRQLNFQWLYGLVC